MIHPHTQAQPISSEVGLGVFATHDIPRGTIVWALDPFDLRLDAAALARLPSPLQAAVLRGGHVGEAGELVFCWDHARYMNHSCDPTCIELGHSFEIARRTIRAGEELTCDYFAVGTRLSFECRCGQPSCRGQILPSEPKDEEDQGAELAELTALAARLPQPLLDYASPDARQRAVFEELRRLSRASQQGAGRRGPVVPTLRSVRAPAGLKTG